MFVAIDRNKNRVNIDDAILDVQYFCPICEEKLKIKAKESETIHTYFSHIKKCTDDFTHDMSEWHYNWQMLFPEQNREIVIDQNGIKHRADILINNTVIEFQHSQITREEIQKRNFFYLSCGYDVVWVFDANGKIKNEIDDSINPTVCDSEGLCWKRARSQFRDNFPEKVVTLLHYKLDDVSNQDVMILLKRNHEKYIHFYKTYCIITPTNLLKQYGVITDTNTQSISDIIKETQKRISEQKNKVTHHKSIVFIQPQKRKFHL